MERNLNSWYAPNELSNCTAEIVNIPHVPSSKISLRACTEKSLCQVDKTTSTAARCQNNSSIYRKSNRICKSKYHKSLSCSIKYRIT